MHKRMMMTCLLMALPLFGQSAPKASTHNESLLIGPGDLLHVSVYDTPQLDQNPRVDDGGNVPLLFLGNIKLAGDTPGQAAAEIEHRLIAGGVMQHPQVSINVVQYATQDVSVIGQVSKPGNYPIETPRSIMEVLSMAGGLTPMADRTVLIRRRDTQLKPETFFVANSPSKDDTSDLKISPGDTIVVGKVGIVYVLGDVARPGGYPIVVNDSQITLMQTIAEAGSLNKTAVISGTRLLRKTNGNYTVVPIDFGAIRHGKAPDITLEANDVLFVPFSYAKNFVLQGSALAESVASAAVFIP